MSDTVLGNLFYVVANFPDLRVDFSHSKPYRGAKSFPLLIIKFSIKDCGVSANDVISDLRQIIQPHGNYCDYRLEDNHSIKVKLWL